MTSFPECLLALTQHSSPSPLPSSFLSSPFLPLDFLHLLLVLSLFHSFSTSSFLCSPRPICLSHSLRLFYTAISLYTSPSWPIRLPPFLPASPADNAAAGQSLCLQVSVQLSLSARLYLPFPLVVLRNIDSLWHSSVCLSVSVSLSLYGFVYPSLSICLFQSISTYLYLFLFSSFFPSSFLFLRFCSS